MLHINHHDGIEYVALSEIAYIERQDMDTCMVYLWRHIGAPRPVSLQPTCTAAEFERFAQCFFPVAYRGVPCYVNLCAIRSARKFADKEKWLLTVRDHYNSELLCTTKEMGKLQARLSLL